MKLASQLATFGMCALFVATTSLAGEAAITLEEGAGRDITTARCLICHSLDYITMNAAILDRKGWESAVRKMIDRFGAPVSDAEASTIVDYLTELSTPE